jgi:hypothetical protein
VAERRDGGEDVDRGNEFGRPTRGETAQNDGSRTQGDTRRAALGFV